jgi:hypothetical protein
LGDAADAILTAAPRWRRRKPTTKRRCFSFKNDSLTSGQVSHFALQGASSRDGTVTLLWEGRSLSVKESLTRLRDHLRGDGSCAFALKRTW